MPLSAKFVLLGRTLQACKRAAVRAVRMEASLPWLPLPAAPLVMLALMPPLAGAFRVQLERTPPRPVLLFAQRVVWGPAPMLLVPVASV